MPLYKAIVRSHLLEYCTQTLRFATIETVRLRGDEIEVFTILNGYENIDGNIFLTQEK